MSRLEEDREKLLEAVAIFRERASLHGSSSPEALIRWAHQGGKGKPQAPMVREKWHDFAAGRRYADLPVQDYVVEYHHQAELFDEASPTSTDIALDKFQGGDSTPSPETGGRPTEAGTVESPPVTDELVACEHKVRVNSGTSIVCDKCGEVIEELPECSHEGTTVRGHDDKTRLVCRACGADVGEAEPEIAPPSTDDEQEVLF
jgi:hypothetical protein